MGVSQSPKPQSERYFGEGRLASDQFLDPREVVVRYGDHFLDEFRLVAGEVGADDLGRRGGRDDSRSDCQKRATGNERCVCHARQHAGDGSPRAIDVF